MSRTSITKSKNNLVPFSICSSVQDSSFITDSELVVWLRAIAYAWSCRRSRSDATQGSVYLTTKLNSTWEIFGVLKFLNKELRDVSRKFWESLPSFAKVREWHKCQWIDRCGTFLSLHVDPRSAVSQRHKEWDSDASASTWQQVCSKIVSICVPGRDWGLAWLILCQTTFYFFDTKKKQKQDDCIESETTTKKRDRSINWLIHLG